MKKLLFAVVLGLLFLAALSSTALADNGPHGRFNGSTDACASCHRVHSAVSADGMLLVHSEVYDLCTACHDGSGAATNVVDGYYDTALTTKATDEGQANHGLFGGGFVNTRMLTDYGNTANQLDTTNVGVANINTSTTAWAVKNSYDVTSTQPASRATTSKHIVNSATTHTVWGAGNFYASGTSGNNFVNTSTSPNIALECTSCHTPHGAAGKTGGLTTGAPMPSYRLLNYTPGGSNGFEVSSEVGTTGYWDTDMAYKNTALLNKLVAPVTAGVTVYDSAVKWYTPNNDLTQDVTLAAYRGTSSGATSLPEMWLAIGAGQGDYGLRYFAYKRPNTHTYTTAVAGTTQRGLITCPTGLVGSTGPASTGATACSIATNDSGGTLSVTVGTSFDNVPAHDALGYWCSTCHDRYLAPGSASRTADSTDPGYHYRHRAAGNSSSAFGTGSIYSCIDCHNAHGTSAQSTTVASAASYANSSALLKADNRAICLRCHAPAVNFFNTDTTSSAFMVTPP